MRGFHPYFKIMPTVRAYVARPFRYGVTGAPHGCLAVVLVVAIEHRYQNRGIEKRLHLAFLFS